VSERCSKPTLNERGGNASVFDQHIRELDILGQRIWQVDYSEWESKVELQT
jgi:hypothetical protein